MGDEAGDATDLLAITPSVGVGANGGEDMVQDFVRLHMLSILQPFSDRVQELQGQLEQLWGEFSATRESVDTHESRLDQHEQQLSALEGGAAQASERLDKSQAAFAALKKEQARLDGNHEMTKAALGKARETLGQAGASVEALQRALEESNGRVGQLETNLPEAEQRLMQHLETRLDKQGKTCRELNDRQAEMMKTCQQARALGESATAAVKQLAASSGQRLQEDMDSLSGLSERARELEAKALEVCQRLDRHDEVLKVNDKDIMNMKTWSGRMDEVTQLQQKHASVANTLKEHQGRLDKAEADLGQARQDSVSERQLQITEMNSLQQEVQKNIADVVRWRDNQKAQCDILSTAGERLEGLEKGQGQLQARATTAERELQSLSSWRESAGQQLEAHTAAVDAHHKEISRAKDRIENASAGVQSVRSDIGADREVMSKLSQRIEMCCAYFNGLGKGLQDTSRQMASGESGLLPPKPGGGGATALPALPRGPGSRTPRTSVSPRKPLVNVA